MRMRISGEGADVMQRGRYNYLNLYVLQAYSPLLKLTAIYFAILGRSPRKTTPNVDKTPRFSLKTHWMS